MKVDFFIVGAPKAGTTSLYNYLNEHPEIVMSTKKETDYFSNESIEKQGMYYGKKRIMTLERYHSLFPVSENKIYGEASVSYLFYKDVPKKIKDYNANAKIIVMLRNPIDRAFSHYLMDYRLGLSSNSFDQIIKKKLNNKKAHLYYQQYVELGLYYNQIKRYFDFFGKENICIIFFHDFKNNPEKEVKRVYNFLGLVKNYKSEINKQYNTFSMLHNVYIRKLYSMVWLRKFLRAIIPKEITKIIKSKLMKKDRKPELILDIRNKLKKLFIKDILLLEELLKKDLSRWTK